MHFDDFAVGLKKEDGSREKLRGCEARVDTAVGIEADRAGGGEEEGFAVEEVDGAAENGGGVALGVVQGGHADADVGELVVRPLLLWR